MRHIHTEGESQSKEEKKKSRASAIHVVETNKIEKYCEH